MPPVFAQPEVAEPDLEAVEPDLEVAAEVQRYPTVEKYFSAGNPNPLSHRIGEPLYERRVSNSRKKAIIKRDGNACLVCGASGYLEVDHRIALMNGGSNEDSNLGTLCDDCHNKKTRLDYKIRKRRQLEEQRRE